MSRFIESIKIEDQEIFLLALHQQRVNEVLKNFGSEASLDITEVYKKLQHTEDGLFKLRIVYELSGKFQAQLIPYATSEISSICLAENNGFDYAFKFEDRKEFDKMKQKNHSEEIIIVKNNHITDASIANLVFKKGKEWFTPSTFLLNGVQRQHLLNTKKIKQTEITLQNLKEFSHFQIINALNDFDDQFIYPLEKISNL